MLFPLFRFNSDNLCVTCVWLKKDRAHFSETAATSCHSSHYPSKPSCTCQCLLLALLPCWRRAPPDVSNGWSLVYAATYRSTYPASISKMRMPRAHQSTARPWPLLWMTSGARYSGVPHRVQVLIRQKQMTLKRVIQSDFILWASLHFISRSLCQILGSPMPKVMHKQFVESNILYITLIISRCIQVDRLYQAPVLLIIYLLIKLQFLFLINKFTNSIVWHDDEFFKISEIITNVGDLFLISLSAQILYTVSKCLVCQCIFYKLPVVFKTLTITYNYNCQEQCGNFPKMILKGRPPTLKRLDLSLCRKHKHPPHCHFLWVGRGHYCWTCTFYTVCKERGSYCMGNTTHLDKVICLWHPTWFCYLL